jgi:diguanylate cyclase (GGDEF)-like protein
MRVVGRDDARLFLGLAIGLVVVFARPIGELLDIARDVERTYDLSLIPGLIILVVVLVFHLQEKRQSVKAEAAASASTARQAEQRSNELERLVAFSKALAAQGRDLGSIREVLLQHMSYLVGHHEVWVVVRSADPPPRHWQTLLGGAVDPELLAHREHLADRLVEQGGAKTAPSEGRHLEGHKCYALVVGDEIVGVMGVPEVTEPLSAALQRVLSTAAALLAVSVKNAQLFSELRDNSLRDALSGLFNRAHAMGEVEKELRRARRSQLPVSLIMFDIDHFKQINDRYGHLCGDAVIAMVGRRVCEAVRSSDTKCRYGGEEFLVLLPETTLEGGMQVAENLQRELRATPIQWQDELIAITASFGLTLALPQELDPAALIARADAALYRAKHDGRDCIRVSTEPVLV